MLNKIKTSKITTPNLVNDTQYDPYENQMRGMMRWLTK